MPPHAPTPPQAASFAARHLGLMPGPRAPMAGRRRHLSGLAATASFLSNPDALRCGHALPGRTDFPSGNPVNFAPSVGKKHLRNASCLLCVKVFSNYFVRFSNWRHIGGRRIIFPHYPLPSPPLPNASTQTNSIHPYEHIQKSPPLHPRRQHPRRRPRPGRHFHLDRRQRY